MSTTTVEAATWSARERPWADLMQAEGAMCYKNPQVPEDYVYLTVDAADYLAQAGIKLIGIDYLSVDRFGTVDYPSHHALLEAGVVIVEGLDLSEVEPGEYDMTCLPLRIVGAEGAPARVILRSRL